MPINPSFSFIAGMSIQCTDTKRPGIVILSNSVIKKLNNLKKITIKYFNENQSWDPDEVVEYFEEYTKENNISIDLSLYSYPYEIKERARILLKHLYLQQRNTYRFSIPATLLGNVDLLDLVTLPNGVFAVIATVPRFSVPCRSVFDSNS